jgi:hypothetical protein
MIKLYRVATFGLDSKKTGNKAILRHWYAFANCNECQEKYSLWGVG